MVYLFSLLCSVTSKSLRPLNALLYVFSRNQITNNIGSLFGLEQRITYFMSIINFYDHFLVLLEISWTELSSQSPSCG